MAKITVIARTRLGGEQPYGGLLWDGEKIRPNVLVIKGVEVPTYDITYYLRYTRQGKQKVENVGKVLADIYQRRRVIEATLAAESNGLTVTHGVGVTPTPTVVPSNRTTITNAVTAYLDDLRMAKRPHKSIQGKQKDLDLFMAVCADAVYLDQFQRSHVLAYKHHLEHQDYAPKSVENMMMSVVTFFNKRGVELGLEKADWPVYRDHDPEPYSDEEMVALLKNSTGRINLVVRTLVATGLREQELAHLTKADLDSRRKLVLIQPKTCAFCKDCSSRGSQWRPKTLEGIRDIPIGEGLLKELLALPDGLLFPSSTGRIEGHLLRDIQAVAKKAGVLYAKLHRFRDTFITNKIRDGVDIRTVQGWAGHKDINVTMATPHGSTDSLVRLESLLIGRTVATQ